MNGAAGALLKAGLAIKLGHVKQATSAYVRDRTDQGKSAVTGYLIAAGFYVAGGIFLIAALLVGATALFRWIELKYGLFTAFGATGGLLVVLMILCMVIASIAMRPSKKHYPSLSSRLRVALRAAPGRAGASLGGDGTELAAGRTPVSSRDHIASARNTATSILKAPPVARSGPASQQAPMASRAGAVAAVGLIGWALARRYRQPRRIVSQARPRS